MDGNKTCDSACKNSTPASFLPPKPPILPNIECSISSQARTGPSCKLYRRTTDQHGAYDKPDHKNAYIQKESSIQKHRWNILESQWRAFMCSKSSHHLLPSTCDSATNRCARQCLWSCPAPTSISCCYSNTSFHLDSNIRKTIRPSIMIPLIEESSIVGSSSPTYLLKFFVPRLLVCWPSGHHTILSSLVSIKSLDIDP